MSVDTHSLFARVIQDHLELKERNSELDPVMPIDRYTTGDPFGNHPLFKSEEQARIEETMDGAEPAVALVSAALPWPGEETNETTVAGDGEGLAEGEQGGIPFAQLVVEHNLEQLQFDKMVKGATFACNVLQLRQ